jgi:putative endonuclease
MTIDRRKARGAIGEAAAVERLRALGIAILATNWRCRIGELDIIAEQGGVILFIEVRTRAAASLSAFGTPLESITMKKQNTLRRCAEAYLQRLPSKQPHPRIRFDCIAVLLNDRDEPIVVEHLQDAF